jgi:F0F1-type ATP synthase alpha subunit
MEIKTEAITKLLRQQIEKLDLSVDVTEVGEVIAIGDGEDRPED